MKYPFVIVTESLNPKHLAASKGPVIFVRPRYKSNPFIYRHEMKHIWQWYALAVPLLALAGYLYWIGSAGWFAAVMAAMLAHNMLYDFSRTYRCWAEVKAYKAQADGNAELLPAFAKTLAAIYDLDITPSQALEKLRKA